MTQTITLWGCVIVFACAVAMAQKRLSTPPKIASGPSCAGPVTKTGKKGLQACRSASSSKTTFFSNVGAHSTVPTNGSVLGRLASRKLSPPNARAQTREIVTVNEQNVG
jgi:hypothetical protein